MFTNYKHYGTVAMLCRFVVQLCDPVQIETIELGNLELFSSLPKTFALYVSDRCVLSCFMFFNNMFLMIDLICITQTNRCHCNTFQVK